MQNGRYRIPDWFWRYFGEKMPPILMYNTFIRLSGVDSKDAAYAKARAGCRLKLNKLAIMFFLEV